MNILIVPDSFKGSLSSKEVCENIKAGIDSVQKHNITCLPFADGGEGFGECLCNFCNGNILYTYCSDIYLKKVKGHIYTYGDTAIIETATASGLQKKKDVMNATSYGTGELIKFAVSKGFKNIILGLGGSGCCDAGAGALAALGAVFRDIDGDEIDFPAGKDLNNIYGVGFTNIVKDINFTFACDVENVFFGKNGAAYVFAKQKGANDKQVKELDDGLKMINAFLPRDIRNVKGGGSAGGICGALYSVYGGKIKSGFDILSETADLEEKIKKNPEMASQLMDEAFETIPPAQIEDKDDIARQRRSAIKGAETTLGVRFKDVLETQKRMMTPASSQKSRRGRRRQ